MVGRLLFYNVYLAGGHWNNDVVFTGQPLDQGQAFIRSSDGPASAELIDVLRTKLTPERIAFAKRNLTASAAEDEFFYGRYVGNPDALVDHTLRSPSLSYYFFLWQALDGVLGPRGTDRLLWRVSFEILRQRLSLGPRYMLRNIYFFATGVSADYIHSLHPNYNLKVSQPNLAGIVSYTPMGPDDVLSPKLSSEVRFQLGGGINATMRKALYLLWAPLYLVVRPIVFVLMLFGAAVLWRTAYAPVAVLALLIVVYQMLIVCVFVMPIDRYVIETILVELLVAAPAVVGVVRWIAGWELALRHVG
jgi:hypothetical protein